MWFITVIYTDGSRLPIGPFKTSPEALSYGNELKKKASTMVVDFTLQRLTAPIPE